MYDTQVCFITGGQATGTSTLAGILNCHPEVLMLYEVRMYYDQLSRYGRLFIEAFPDSRTLFRFEQDPGIAYARLVQWLQARGRHYRYVGDKLPSVNVRLLNDLQPYRVLFTCRDIRTWLCKNSVVSFYMTEYDVVPAAIDYTKCLIESFLLPTCLRIRMEDMIRDNLGMVERLSEFLDLDLTTHLDAWWTKVGRWTDDPFKSALKWWELHPSCRLEPQSEDTQVLLRPHDFWDALLPIFDKYFQDPAGSFSPSEIQRDLSAIDAIGRLEAVGLRDCYQEITSVCFKRRAEDGHMISDLPAVLNAGEFRNEFSKVAGGPKKAKDGQTPR